MSGTASGGWHTPRLLIRGWAPPDAPELKAAIDGSLAELQRWMAWARSEPSDLPVIEERLARFQAEFEAGTNWACGIFLRSSGEVLGGVSLLPRIGPGALELGYWLRNECTGRGNGRNTYRTSSDWGGQASELSRRLRLGFGRGG